MVFLVESVQQKNNTDIVLFSRDEDGKKKINIIKDFKPYFYVPEEDEIPDDFRIIGTYIHGIFDNPEITSLWLNSIGLENIKTSEFEGIEARDKEYDLLAQHFKDHINTADIIDVINFQ